MEGHIEPFDPQHMVDVLAEIWGREHGYKVTITLSPKEEAPKESVSEKHKD